MLLSMLMQGCTVSYAAKTTPTTQTVAFRGEVKVDAVALLLGGMGAPAAGLGGFSFQ